MALYAKDAHTPTARALLLRVGPVVVSDWAVVEFSAAIRLKARQGVVSATLLDDLEDHLTARALVRRHYGLRAPDALHIAVASRLGVALATFDTRQAEAARREGLATVEQ